MHLDQSGHLAPCAGSSQTAEPQGAGSCRRPVYVCNGNYNCSSSPRAVHTSAGRCRSVPTSPGQSPRHRNSSVSNAAPLPSRRWRSTPAGSPRSSQGCSSLRTTTPSLGMESVTYSTFTFRARPQLAGPARPGRFQGGAEVGVAVVDRHHRGVVGRHVDHGHVGSNRRRRSARAGGGKRYPDVDVRPGTAHTLPFRSAKLSMPLSARTINCAR